MRALSCNMPSLATLLLFTIVALSAIITPSRAIIQQQLSEDLDAPDAFVNTETPEGLALAEADASTRRFRPGKDDEPLIDSSNGGGKDKINRGRSALGVLNGGARGRAGECPGIQDGGYKCRDGGRSIEFCWQGLKIVRPCSPGGTCIPASQARGRGSSSKFVVGEVIGPEACLLSFP